MSTTLTALSIVPDLVADAPTATKLVLVSPLPTERDVHSTLPRRDPPRSSINSSESEQQHDPVPDVRVA